ncbi:apolipoprotein N-acyltransferase [Catenovulum sp. SX2]|uniref:apolipoprotein N-acyltransferase n=1 Tax=Catenovulum sp. SX2 TaxID=3398614 RepID=UPI003F87C602
MLSRFSKGLLRCAAAFISSVFILLAFYFPNANSLIFIALIPVILASVNLKWRQAALLWLAAAIAFALGIYITLPDIFIEKAADKHWVAYIGSALITIWQIMPFIVFAGLASFFRYHSLPYACLRMATLLTLLIHFMPSPFALSFATHIELPLLFLQLADLGGIALLDFLVIYLNFKVAFCIHKFFTEKALDKVQVMTVAAVAAGILLYGYIRINQIESELLNSSKLSQVTIVPSDFKTAVTRNQQVEYLAEQTLSAVENSQSDLIIWPELPNPVRQKGGVAFTRAIEKIGEKTSAPVLTHNLSFTSEFNSLTHKPYRYNLLSLFKDKQLAAEHKKQVLLPFVEYLPFENWLREYFPKTHIYKAGKSTNVMSLNQTLNIAPLICYEADFAKYAQAAVSSGANLLVSVANETWSHSQYLARKHFYQAQLRAIENRVALVRVTNSGYNGVIEPTGKINWQAYGAVAAPTLAIKTLDASSFYSYYPNALWLIMVLAGWLMSKQSWVRRLGNKAHCDL